MTPAEAAGRELADGWPPPSPEVVEAAARIIVGALAEKEQRGD